MTKNEVLTPTNKDLHVDIGEHVGFELGAKMVKDYYDKFQEGGAQFIGRNVLEKILEQADCIGINIYKALNEKGEKTYVLVGVAQDGSPIFDFTVVNDNGHLEKIEGIVADRNKNVNWFRF